jgi:SAM-dependent methyltransferase
MSRVEKLLFGLDLANMQGLEIGALNHPIVDRSHSGIRYLDHLDTAGLREKYRDNPTVDIETIVDVAFVHQAGTLSDTVAGARFDYVVASHVAEHVPDLIGWLQQVAQILKPEGVLALAVPDMRFSFDGRRQPSTIVDALDAHLAGLQRPSFRQALDYQQYVTVAGDAGWLERLWQDPALARQVPLLHPNRIRSLGVAELRRYHRAMAEGLYIDAHCWVWTPASLLEIWTEMAHLDLLPYTLRSFETTQPGSNEFLLTLRRLPDAADDDIERARRREQVLASLQPAIEATAGL